MANKVAFCYPQRNRTWLLMLIGGERGIRTPDTLAGTPDFESGAVSRPTSSPNLGAALLRAAARRPAGLAERVGFEPTIRCRIHAFQACAFGRSATSPLQTFLRSRKNWRRISPHSVAR